MIPDWQLPIGVDRGLHDYLHSTEMVAGYDAMMAESALARQDIQFCETVFPQPGRLIDLGCGTGRLCLHFARAGFDCVGVDLSEVMLKQAQELSAKEQLQVRWQKDNLVTLETIPDAQFDYAACLFSTLGMIRGAEHRRAALRSIARVLKPGGRFVLHVHNRYFRGLGWRGWFSGDLTMPQAYGGAPLTLHHFSKREAVHGLQEAGFCIREVTAVGLEKILPAGFSLLNWRRAYGFLILSEKLG